MSFIRIKRRRLKGGIVSYAYLVKNRWMKKTGMPKQVVSKYLGRVLEGRRTKLDFFTSVGTTDPESYLGTSNRDRIFVDLIKWEIARHGFDGVSFYRYRKTVIKDKKDVVLKMNNGYLCGFTIRRLFNFIPKEDDERETGIRLAELLTDAGIGIPREVFVALFDKIAGTTY